MVRKKYINGDDIDIEELQRKLKLSILLGESNMWGQRGGHYIWRPQSVKESVEIEFCQLDSHDSAQFGLH